MQRQSTGRSQQEAAKVTGRWRVAPQHPCCTCSALPPSGYHLLNSSRSWKWKSVRTAGVGPTGRQVAAPCEREASGGQSLLNTRMLSHHSSMLQGPALQLLHCTGAPVSACAALRHLSCSRNISLALRMLCLRARRKRRSAKSSASGAKERVLGWHASCHHTSSKLAFCAGMNRSHEPASKQAGAELTAPKADGCNVPNSGCSGPASISISSRSCCTSCHSCTGARCQQLDVTSHAPQAAQGMA